MPTGIPIHDIRDQLFAAAHRVLLCDGPAALTSRAVTAEAGVAKGIIHRHFPDFNTFLAAMALRQIEALDVQSVDLRAAAGTGTVADNLAKALATALDPVAIRTIGLVCSRRALLARMRLTTPTGIPVAAETAKMIAGYLTTERGLGRIPLTADVDALAIVLTGGAHLRAAELDERPLAPGDLRSLLQSVLGAMSSAEGLDGRPNTSTCSARGVHDA